MSKFDFKIALNGQIYDSEGLLYAYPEKVAQLRATGQYPAWVNALPFDSRFLRELVVAGGECFSVRYGKEGLFYLYTRYNPHDSRNGAVYIALYAQNYAASDANQLIITLRNLMDYFLEKQSPIGILDTDIEEITKDLSTPYYIKPPTQQQETLGNDVYRVYQKEEELQRYLNCPIQKEYIECKWVHFISSDYKKTIINPSLYTELTTRVMDCYAIKHSDANYELALSGSAYKLSYTKEGYLPQTVSIVIGQHSKYTEENNHIIRFKAANEIDLKFKKRITILLYDAATNAPIVENGLQVSSIVEIEEGKTRNVSVSAPGYASKMVLVDPSKQNTAEGTMRQNLQRITPVNQGQQSNKYDYMNDWDTKDFLQVRKRPLIITTIALAAIALVIGYTGGFFTEKYLLPKENTTIIDSLTQENGRLLDCNNALVSENTKLKEEKEALLAEQDKLNKKIADMQQPRPTSSADHNQQQAREKAIEFLQMNNTWSLQGMSSFGGNNLKSKIRQTNEYNWLKVIVEGDKLNDNRLNIIISNTDALKNPKWADIVELIKAKKNQGKTINDFKKAFKNANSNWDSNNGRLMKSSNGQDKEMSDGTIKLSNLYNNIRTL